MADRSRSAGGYTVPAGSNILINAYMMHHDENYFKDPLKFDPERFVAGVTGSSEDSSRHHFSYIPFSAGYRNCIGKASLPLNDRLRKNIFGFHGERVCV